MSIYLFQNDKKTGPFSEDQVLQMLQASTVSPDTLGWREGLADWERLSALFPNTGDLPSPPRGNSPLGIISFILSLISVVGWFVLLVVGAIAHNSGIITRTFNIITGVFVLGLILLNLLALIFGVIGILKSKANTLAIVGTCLNGLLLIIIIALMCFGVAAKYGH